MATVTGYTAERMKEIEDTTVVDGNIVGDDLILITREGTEINAGDVRGIQGIQGIPGPTSIAVATSTTRPTGGALFNGLGLYETDTKRFYIYDAATTTWLYRGGLWICTSATRPASPFEGLEIYETDTDNKYVWNGTAWVRTFQSDWVSFTPNVRNVGSPDVTRSIVTARYTQVGKLVKAIVRVNITGNSAASGLVTIDLPVPIAVAQEACMIGRMGISDVSANKPFLGDAFVRTADTPDTIYIIRDQSVGNLGENMQLASTDVVWYNVEYEAAGY
jgi:hypothetical protein